MNNVIGIDPGGSGAIVYISEDRKSIKLHKLEGRSFHEIADILRQYNYATTAYIEKVGAFPQQGRSSIFKFGKVYGVVLGVLAAYSIPWKDVSPGVWQRSVGLAQRRSKKERKHAQRDMAQQLFPVFKPTLETGDAFLIAEHGWRLENQ